MSHTSYTIRTLNECTIDQAVELWNGGFSQYYSDMTQTVDRFMIYLGTKRIAPTLSVGMFVEDRPAGFVLVALKTVDGKLLAWNGGTGLHPDFRGMGLAKPLMRAAVDNMRAAGVNAAYLEVVTKNVKAIAAYEGAGFRIVDDLIGLKREGAFDLAPFVAGNSADAYAIKLGKPADVIRIPFFLPHSPWGGQWFQLQSHGGDSLQVVDAATGQAVGYALYLNNYNDRGELSSIVLHHCEASPEREDADAIVRTALAHVYGPHELPILRQTDNLRSTNPAVMAALTEAGFEAVYEQKLMLFEFGV
jgi:ribosomal protein S18 acetylase RimI-like enzyme